VLLGGGEGLVEVRDQVVHVLDADRQPHEVLRHAGVVELLGGELRVRRGRVVDRQRLGVADVGEVAEQLQRLDEPPAAVASGRDAEADQAAVAATGEDPVGDLLGGVPLQPGVADPGDRVVGLEVLRDGQRVPAGTARSSSG
jgi:hypothetical protein